MFQTISKVTVIVLSLPSQGPVSHSTMPAKVAAQTYLRLMTPVDVPACFSFGDCYGLAIMIVLGPGIVLVAVLALFLALCPLLMVMVYGRCR